MHLLVISIYLFVLFWPPVLVVMVNFQFFRIKYLFYFCMDFFLLHELVSVALGQSCGDIRCQSFNGIELLLFIVSYFDVDEFRTGLIRLL